jgi:hypothetical protein
MDLKLPIELFLVGFHCPRRKMLLSFLGSQNKNKTFHFQRKRRQLSDFVEKTLVA